MFSFSNLDESKVLRNGTNQLTCQFPANFFQSGQYFLSIFIIEDRRRAIFVEKDIISFTVVDGGREMGVYMGREPGYIKPQFEWSFE
jgi:lipopolysaccharide transport system ATP-binding protein